MKIQIVINNNRCRLLAPPNIIEELIDLTKIKDPKSFWSQAKRQGRWDGNVRYITYTGAFDTGLLPLICEQLKEAEIRFEFVDQRETFKDLHEVTELGGLKLTGKFDYQGEAIKSVTKNAFEGIKYPRGILYDATNAGKNLIASGIFASFAQKRRGLFIINNSVIYEQALEELEKLLPGEVGRFDTKKQIWKRVTIIMAQSLSSRMKKDPKIKAELGKQDIIIVDECDIVVNTKAFADIRLACYDAPVWVGLTGTAYGKWPKDKLLNRKLLQVFGPIVHTIRNKELVERGVSTLPHITFMLAPFKTYSESATYADIYDLHIVKNKKRNLKIWKRAARAFKKNRGPVLIMIKHHEHVKRLLNCMPETIAGVFKVEYCHHKTKGRKNIFERFNGGTTDILIASMIIKRGLNLKKIRTLINAAGGDSDRNTTQVLGRALRRDEEKDVVYMEDFYDHVPYLRRHSKHRIRVYEVDEQFPVNKLYLKKVPKRLIFKEDL